MKERISALLDNELDAVEAGSALGALREAGEAREAWSTYHLIGDALRGGHGLPADFAVRVAERIAREPTVLAPMAQPAAQPERQGLRWSVLTLAASVAAFGLVAWLAIGPQQAQQVAAPVAQSPAAAPASRAELARVPPPAATADYLLAHQRYSPRNSLQGVAPYVLTVSGDAGARKP